MIVFLSGDPLIVCCNANSHQSSDKTYWDPSLDGLPIKLLTLHS